MTRARGQALAEFAIVMPLLAAAIGAIVQFGLLFWAQNTLTQVTRDTGRWAATQTTSPCSSGASAVLAEANTIAGNSSLFAYTAPWALTASGEGLNVSWAESPATVGDVCPPSSNAKVWMASITITHVIPVFFPGMQYLPGMGKCADGSPCATLSSTAVFRMEPAP